MKGKTLIPVFLAACVACVLMGCSYRYSVEVRNAGSEMIKVDNFCIGSSKKSEVGIGDVYPQYGKSYGPITQAPKSEVVIQWSQGGVVKWAKVALKLPREFTRKRGDDIVFVINPEKGTVKTKYRVLELPSYDRRTIEGETFYAEPSEPQASAPNRPH